MIALWRGTLIFISVLATVLIGCTSEEDATDGSSNTSETPKKTFTPAAGQGNSPNLNDHLDKVCEVVTQYARLSADPDRETDANELPDAADAAAASAELDPSWMIISEATRKLADWAEDQAAGSPYADAAFQLRQVVLGDIEIACAQRERTGDDELTTLDDGRPDPAIIDRSEEGAADAILACSRWLEGNQLDGSFEYRLERAVKAATRASDASQRWSFIAAALTARLETLTLDGQSPDFEEKADAGLMAIRATSQACGEVIHIPTQFAGEADEPQITIEELREIIKPQAEQDSQAEAPEGGYEAGLFCRDIAERDGSYGDAVAYWHSEGRPTRMDASKNGTPCQTVYPDNEIDAYWQQTCGFDPAAAERRVIEEFQERADRDPTDTELERFVDMLRADMCGLPSPEDQP